MWFVHIAFIAAMGRGSMVWFIPLLTTTVAIYCGYNWPHCDVFVFHELVVLSVFVLFWSIFGQSNVSRASPSGPPIHIGPPNTMGNLMRIAQTQLMTILPTLSTPLWTIWIDFEMQSMTFSTPLTKINFPLPSIHLVSPPITPPQNPTLLSSPIVPIPLSLLYQWPHRRPPPIPWSPKKEEERERNHPR